MCYRLATKGGATKPSVLGVDAAHRGDAESARDGQSLEALFRLHYSRLVKTLCLITLDRETAADAAQEAFLQLHLHWDRVSVYEDPIGWVYRVALNRCRDYRRQLVRLARLWERQASELAIGQDVSWYPEHEFVEALRELPRRQREAAAFHYIAGFSLNETAQAMGLSEGAVKSHLFRARETLQAKLEVEP
jgi:RNA polymerase sigma factor (sigma-70 family)